MKRFLLIICWLINGISSVSAQEEFRFMTYNVENLFDTVHDSLKNDRDFLPEAPRHWNYSRYKKKLDHLAQCIIATGKWQPPALVALCEVENDNVLRQLTRYSSLRKANYRYVMTQSPDERGMNVALLYQREQFRLLNKASHPILFPSYQFHRPTRDILHVTGQILTGDTLDIFVIHFPSRSNGEKESEPARLFVARQLRSLVDSTMQNRKSPLVIIMGDFNDYPHNRSLKEVLKVSPPPSLNDSTTHMNLYSLTEPLKKEKIGTYKYQGEWGILDHILVNGRMLSPESPLHIPLRRAEIVKHSFLLEHDSKSLGVRPFRTYNGFRYQGGYSDHLPVTVRCILQTNTSK